MSFPGLFYNPQYSAVMTEIFGQMDNSKRTYISGVLNSQANFIRCELSVDLLKEWIQNWRGDSLGNFANFLLNALEFNGRFDDDSVRRIRSVVHAFRLQEKEIIKQMCAINVQSKVIERGYVDPDTAQELAQFTIEFEGGVEAYIPIDDKAADILKAKNLSFFLPKSYIVNEYMKIPVDMEKAIQLGILKTETVEDINNFPTVCSNPNWTKWHELIRFFEYYTRDEDTRVQWDKQVFEFWVPPALHPTIKRLLVTTRSITGEHLRRTFPYEVSEVRHIENQSFHKGNQIFQIRTGIYARETILAYNGNWDVVGVRETGLRFLAGIFAEINKDTSVSHAIISEVATYNQMSEIVDTDNVHFLRHSINVTGWETILEKVQVIWIVGAPHPPQSMIWRQAQKYFGNDRQPLLYEKDLETGLYKDDRLQSIYEQNIAAILRSIINRIGLYHLSDKTVVLMSGIELPGITDNVNTLLFDWEDFEVAGGLDKLPEVIATRQHFETERDNLTGRSDREKVEHILGCSSRQANRYLKKLRGGAPLRVPFRTQILSLLDEGDKKTAEFVKSIEGNPEAIKNELKRLIERGEIVRVQRGVYSTPSKDSIGKSQNSEQTNLSPKST